MGLWIIERAGEHVRLTYTHEPLAAQPLVQPCGETDAAVEVDLEAWVFDEAQPWDVIRTPRGTFVRQHMPPRDACYAAVGSTPVPLPGVPEASA